MMGVAGAVDPTPIFEAIYYSIKKGANSITKLRKEAKVMELMADATKLSGAGKDELKTVFEQLKKVVQVGERRGMDDATVLKYVDRLAAERSGGEGAFETIVEEMSVWRKPTADQLKADAELAKAHEHLASLRQTKEELEAELRAGPRTADGKPDQERIKELRENLEGLQDEMRFDPAKGKKVPVAGKDIAEAERAVSAAEIAAERAQLDPKLVMRRAFNASKERADKIANVTTDQVGKLKTPPQGLAVDHIVSIKQISEMDGFGKLTVQERNYLAKLEDNLIVMDSSANSSKGERSWSAWSQYSTFYEDATKDIMTARSGELRGQIQKWIGDKVRGR